MSSIDLRLGDCLEIMPTLPAQSFDAIIADIPYGTTACSWDTVIPFAPMWEQLKRLAKPRAAIVLFGSQPFTSALVMSNPKMFRYEWIWEKSHGANFQSANLQPIKTHENILVFSFSTSNPNSKTPIKYNPQMGYGKKVKPTTRKPLSTHMRDIQQGGASYKLSRPEYDGERRFPRSITYCGTDHIKIHPTQKPVALMEYLIRTYTNEGDIVLDFTMGSGTTGVAAVNTNRNFVGIELREDYYNIAQKRIADAQAQIEKEKSQFKQKELL